VIERAKRKSIVDTWPRLREGSEPGSNRFGLVGPESLLVGPGRKSSRSGFRRSHFSASSIRRSKRSKSRLDEPIPGEIDRAQLPVFVGE
jgi:hypothetical protein